MRLMVCVNTAGAEDGYDESNIPTLETHVEDIKELLRSGYYEVEYVDEVRDNE